MHRASSYNMYINQKMHKILVIKLYFLLDALHVSDYISPSSGATFISCTSYLAYAGTIRVAVVWLYQHNSDTYGTGIYRHVPNAMYSL